MKKILFLLIISFSFTAYPQKDLNVKFKTNQGFGVFMPSQVIIWPLAVKPEIKAVPTDVIEYIVRKVDFQSYNTQYKSFLAGDISKEKFESYVSSYSLNRKLFTNLDYNHSIYVLLGKISQNEMIVILDKNNNLSFSDDERFIFPVLSKEEEKIAKQKKTITNVSFDYFNGTKIVKRTEPIHIDPYKGSLGITMKADSIEQKYYFGMGIQTYKFSKVLVNKKSYDFYLANGFTSLDFNKRNTKLLIDNADGNNVDEIKGSIPYNLGDIITIDSLQYEFKNVSTFGDTIELKFLGYNKYPEGFSEGRYLPKMKAVTINRQGFDFKEYRGKYILIDFWGTWCVPCIKLMPQIKALNQKFKGKNFVMVSVAFDENIDKVKQFIADNQMDWINLIQNKNENDIIKKLKISAYPTTMLIDPNGKIVKIGHEVGKIDNFLSETLIKE